MHRYFQELEPYRTLSLNDQNTLFKASILEILILKCYFTFRGGTFVHPTTQEEIVSRDLLLLGTNDVGFVDQFMGIFNRMESLNLTEEDNLILICLSMFDTGRTDMGRLDDREGVDERQQIFVTRLVQQIPPENVTEAMLLRTTLKELKSGFKDILMRTYTNQRVDMGQGVNQFILSLFQ